MLVLRVPPLCSPALCTTNDARRWHPERSIACVPGMSTSPGARAWSTSTAADNAISVLVSIFPTMRFNATLPPRIGLRSSATYKDTCVARHQYCAAIGYISMPCRATYLDRLQLHLMYQAASTREGGQTSMLHASL